MPIAVDSEYALAKETLLRIARETVEGHIGEACNLWKRVTEDLPIQNMPLEPMVILYVNDSKLEFTLSYVVDYRHRTVIQDQLFSKIVEEIKRSDAELSGQAMLIPT